MRREPKDHMFVLCIKNGECDDLETCKVYRRIVDPKVEKDGYLRVIDESADDYVYPVFYFVQVELPEEAEQAIAATEYAVSTRQGKIPLTSLWRNRREF